MLACVPRMALRTNFPNLKTLIAPKEHVNGHLSGRQRAWRNMRCWQILDLNVVSFDVETGKFSNTAKVNNDFICIYHISPNQDYTACIISGTYKSIPSIPG